MAVISRALLAAVAAAGLVTMTGQAPVFVASLGGENDSGKWWVVDDRLCQRWYRWLDAKQYCFKLQRVGAAVHWSRDDGLTGTATIARQ